MVVFTVTAFAALTNGGRISRSTESSNGVRRRLLFLGARHPVARGINRMERGMKFLRRSHALDLSIGMLVLFSGVASTVHAEAFLPAMGGGGGSQFIAQCPAGQNLAGFELRAGDDIDAIRPACVVAYGPASVTAPELTTDSGLVPVAGPFAGLLQQVAPGWYGGPGGHIVRVLCPAVTPIVLGMDVESEGQENETINNIHLFCTQAVAAPVAAVSPAAIFDAPYRAPAQRSTRRGDSQRCGGGQVAVGVHGRGGKYVDAIGLICDGARIAPLPPGAVRAQGRVRVDGAESGGSPISICEAAEKARARNSPAAPGLEKQCREQSAVAAVGRVELPGSSGPPIPICDAARTARGRNSPAASGLESQCSELRAQTNDSAPAYDDLFAKGEAIADGDPRFAALRDQQPMGPVRRGFYIAMAIAEGQTAWGPGKQKVLDSLTAAEQEGFKVAISLSLDRYRDRELAATGAAIADADPIVAKARARDPDARYVLGFDIATAIFGDPALGAQGNTATGPGSLGIRDALSANARDGFDASVKLHLSRRY